MNTKAAPQIAYSNPANEREKSRKTHTGLSSDSRGTSVCLEVAVCISKSI